jgi:hypothetical protein
MKRKKNKKARKKNSGARRRKERKRIEELRKKMRSEEERRKRKTRRMRREKERKEEKKESKEEKSEVGSGGFDRSIPTVGGPVKNCGMRDQPTYRVREQGRPRHIRVHVIPILVPCSGSLSPSSP